MDFQEKLKAACANGINAYKIMFKDLMTAGITESEMKQIVWLLEDINDTDHLFVQEAAAFQLSSLQQGQKEFIAASYYLLVASLVKAENYHNMAVTLRDALNVCIQDGVDYKYGILICQNVQKNITDNDLSQDSLIVIYKIISDYYLKINAPEEAVEVILLAVQVFSGFNATQSAYRLVKEAESILIDQKREALLAPVYSALAEASVSENDYDFAEASFKTGFSIYEEFGVKIPLTTMVNYATVKIRLKKPEEALSLYSKILVDYRSTTDFYKNFFIQYHQGICFKDMGQLTKAEAIFADLELTANTIENQLKENLDTSLLESIIDYHLCFSLVLARQEKYDKSLVLLEKSVKLIEILLSTLFRPHFRRGVREKYNNRIMSITDILAEEIPTSQLVFTFCHLKKNSQSDWLSILSWMKYINASAGLTSTDVNEVNNAFKQLEEEGGVFMSGYKEKYDDPFQNPNLLELELNILPENILPWQQFESELRKITKKFNLSNVYDINTTDMVAQVVRQKFENGYTILFSFLRAAGNVVYQIKNQKLKSSVVTYDNVARGFIQAAGDYQRGGSQGDFTNQLLIYSDKIKKSTNGLIEEISKSETKGILFFPSVFDAAFPFIQSVLSDNRINKKLKDGHFFIQSCPLMYTMESRDNCFNKVLIVKSEENRLELFDEELRMVSNAFTEVVDQASLNQVPESVDVIHIISHGQPISMFKDASYSFMFGNSIHLHSFSGLKDPNLKLVYLNACNGADTMNRNQFKIFSTHELTGFTTAALQNMGAYVLGSQWPTLDILSFVYAKIFYSFLHDSRDIRQAYSKTVWTIRNENKEYFAKLLAEIDDPDIRKRKLERLSNAPEIPFNNIFLYSGMLLNGLI